MYKPFEGTRFHLVDLVLKRDKLQGIRTMSSDTKKKTVDRHCLEQSKKSFGSLIGSPHSALRLPVVRVILYNRPLTTFGPILANRLLKNQT